MNLNLSKKKFLDAVGSGAAPPLYAEIAYCEPYMVFEALCRCLRSSQNTILFESVKGPYRIARYSFIVYEPYLVFIVKNGELNICLPSGGKSSVSYRQPLDRLGELIKAYPQKSLPELPPFQGGAAGLLSYDFVRYIENIPYNAADDLGIPDAHFMMADRVISFDHMLKKAWLVISPGARYTELGYRDISGIDWSRAYEIAVEELRVKSYELGAIKNPIAHETPNSKFQIQNSKTNSSLITRHSSLNYEMSKEQYMDMVRRAKEYIAAGDIFQANLSQRISAHTGGRDSWEIYKALRNINPSPFAAYADFGSYRIASSSPERLVMVRDNAIETRPIAGTRPRGTDFKEDELMRAELLLNEKERAEHIMLIDLERNDIGRVSEYGSVSVDELMITEDYSHVIHIVSNVRGLLKKDKTPVDVIKAVFPGGTITGVPKVRCMEIIDELEPVARGPYTGSLGYIGYSGSMDLNIIIRTFVIKDGYAYVQAGAGIVADSDPEKEYYETLKKAEALIRTLEIF